MFNELEQRQDDRQCWRKRSIAALIIGIMPSSVHSTAKVLISMKLGAVAPVPIAQTVTPITTPAMRPTPLTPSKTLAEITLNLPSAGLLSFAPEPNLISPANRFNPSARQLVGIDIASGESLSTPSTIASTIPSTDMRPAADLPVPRIQPVESTLAPEPEPPA